MTGIRNLNLEKVRESLLHIVPLSLIQRTTEELLQKPNFQNTTT